MKCPRNIECSILEKCVTFLILIHVYESLCTSCAHFCCALVLGNTQSLAIRISFATQDLMGCQYETSHEGTSQIEDTPPIDFG